MENPELMVSGPSHQDDDGHVLDNFDDLCLTEVALEGLEGLTLLSLWIRLEEACKQRGELIEVPSLRRRAWSSLLNNQKVQLYHLPEPRPVIPIHEYKRIEDLAEIDVPDHESHRPKYRHGPVKRKKDEAGNSESEDNEDSFSPTKQTLKDPAFSSGWESEKQVPPTAMNSYGIYFTKAQKMRGSCRFFVERRDITCELRETGDDWATAYSKYGDHLIVVADESSREVAVGVAGLTKKQANTVTPLAYCVLEVIARHRHYGHFLVFRGYTMMGRGPQVLKQLHNYTTNLQALGLIVKQKSRCDVDNGSSRYQLLSYVFLRPFARSVKTRIGEWMNECQTLIANAPPPGIPWTMLRKFDQTQTLTGKKLRVRLGHLFPNLNYQEVEKSSLMSTYPELEGGGKIVVFSFSDTPKKVIHNPLPADTAPCVIPENMGIVRGKANKTMILGALRFFKANKERGLTEPELKNMFSTFSVTHRQSERVLKHIQREGYIVQSGRFKSKSKPKRFVLVSSEEERQRYLEEMRRESSCTDQSDEEETLSNVPVPSSSTDATPFFSAEYELNQSKRVLAMANQLKSFAGGVPVLKEYGRFLDPDCEVINPGENDRKEHRKGIAPLLMRVVYDLMDSGRLIGQQVSICNSFLQGTSSVPGDCMEHFMLTVHSSADLEAETDKFVAAQTFKNFVQSILEPSKDSRKVVARLGSSVYQKYRLARLRLFHRYLFYLAHESASADVATRYPADHWGRNIAHCRFTENYKGWITMDHIVQEMPLILFARLIPIQATDVNRVKLVVKCIEGLSTRTLPLRRQPDPVLQHILRDRLFTNALRGLGFGLMCMGLVSRSSVGPSTVCYPEATELFYVHTAINIKNTSSVTADDIVNGLVKEDITADLEDQTLSFDTDASVVHFWNVIAKQVFSPAWKLQRKVPRRPGVRNKAAERSQQKIVLKDVIDRHFPKLLIPVYPEDVQDPSRPPGDQRSVCGFDSTLRMHIRLNWSNANSSARAERTNSYMPDLDDLGVYFPRTKYAQKIFRKGLPQPRSARFIQAKKVTVRTGGKPLKPGPKHKRNLGLGEVPQIRGSKQEISRMFTPAAIGALFRSSHPWALWEEVATVIYIAARDVLAEVRKRPVDVPLLLELLQQLTPDKPCGRSLRECETRLQNMQRQKAVVYATTLVARALHEDPDFEKIKKYGCGTVPRNSYNLKAVSVSWKRFIMIGLSTLLKSKSNMLGRILAAPRGPPPVVSEMESIQQFTLENLTLYAMLTGKTMDQEMLDLMHKYNDRVIVGMATYLKFRAVVSEQKALLLVNPTRMITVGGKVLGLTSKYKEMLFGVNDSFFGAVVKGSECSAICEIPADPKILIPHWLNAILNRLTIQKAPSLNELDRCLVVHDISIVKPSSVTLEDLDALQVDTPGIHIRNALPVVVELLKEIKSEVTERFAEFHQRHERGVPAELTNELQFNQSLAALGLEVPTEEYQNYVQLLQLIKASRSVGITKAAIWEKMEDVCSLPQCQAALSKLLEFSLIIPAGIDEVKYVATLYLDPWVRYRNSGERSAFQTRPWLSFNGDISGELFAMHLRLILRHVWQNGTVKLIDLVAEFRPHILGRNVIEIVLILCEFGLLKRLRMTPKIGQYRYDEITPETEWIDDQDQTKIWITCRKNSCESAVGMSFVEELLGTVPEYIFPDVASFHQEEDLFESNEDKPKDNETNLLFTEELDESDFWSSNEEAVRDDKSIEGEEDVDNGDKENETAEEDEEDLLPDSSAHGSQMDEDEPEVEESPPYEPVVDGSQWFLNDDETESESDYDSDDDASCETEASDSDLESDV